MSLIIVGCKNKDKEEVQQIKERKEVKYVYDFSRTLNNNDKENLENLLKNISLEDGVQYVFCSINNEEQENIETLSKKYFMSLDVAENDYSNRVLILLSIMTRDFKINLGDDVNKNISKEELLQIKNGTIDYFKESKFYDGLNFAFNKLHEEFKN
jgi:uncharacterized membrane protein YgcG